MRGGRRDVAPRFAPRHRLGRGLRAPSAAGYHDTIRAERIPPGPRRRTGCPDAAYATVALARPGALAYHDAVEIVRTVAETRAATRAARERGLTVHLVPTMGALHEGHRSLIRAARGPGHFVVVSVFVNPTQFSPGEDFAAYPRPFDADAAACREEGVDLLLHPTPEVIYPAGFTTTVRVEGLSSKLCGAFRPGHFDGVTTVVAKLFGIVQPDAAYFGQKDAQQAIIIQRMTADLDLPVRIVVCPTVREADGLAMSSRNAYLSPAQRRQAVCLSEALALGERMILAGERDPAAVVQAMRDAIEAAGPCTIDYVAIVDPQQLEPRSRLDGPCLLALAVRIGPARLIDNRLVDAPAARG